MTPRPKKRASLFPAYLPPDQPDLSLEEWATHLGGYIRVIAMRLAQLATLFAVVGGGTAYVATSGTKPEAVEINAIANARIKALEDTASIHGKRISENESLSRAILYISCETLRRVQPATALPPQECR